MDGSSRYDACPLGKFSNQTQASLATAYTACSPGFYSNTEGSFSCLERASGRYSNSPSGATTCEKCFIGRYASSRGSSGCEACPPGKIKNFDASDCDECLENTFANEPSAATECTPCPIGKFSSAGSISCDTSTPTTAPSPSPTLEPTMMQPSAQPTNLPTLSPSLSPSSAPTIHVGLRCPLCPVGRYSANGGSNSAGCLPCNGPGEYSEAGSILCRMAGAGKKPNMVRSAVKNCEVNTFSVGAADNCTVCEGGHSEAGSSSCVDTPPGHYYD